LTRIFKNKGYLSQGKVTKIIKKKSQETITSFVHFLELNFSTDAQEQKSKSPYLEPLLTSVERNSVLYSDKGNYNFTRS